MDLLAYVKIVSTHHKLYVIEGFNGMLYVFSSHCYCHPVIYSLSLYSVNSFIANVICYITIPSLNKVLYLVSYLTTRKSSTAH